jgi:hypothetical protein
MTNLQEEQTTQPSGQTDTRSRRIHQSSASGNGDLPAADQPRSTRTQDLEQVVAAVEAAPRDVVDDLILRIFEKTASDHYNSGCDDEDGDVEGDELMDRYYEDQYELAFEVLGSGVDGIAEFLLADIGAAAALEELRTR